MLAERLTAQLLAGRPARDPVAVAERLLAVQAQDPRAGRLAVRARTRGVTAADVDRALTEDRSLVVTWVNRTTLHLVRSEDYAWLHALTAPQQRKGFERRLAHERVTDPERGVRAIGRALAEEGPLDRDQLRERVARAGVRAEGQSVYQLLGYAAQQGLIVRGPVVGRQHAYVLVRDWLGEQPAVDRDAALAELARRYLRGHGPADDRDLAKWAAIPLRDARAGLRAIGGELRERPDGLVDLRRRPRAAPLPPPRLLGAWEPVLLGWVSREAIVGPHRITVGGLFHPFALVGGRAVATWRLRGGEVRIEPLEEIAPDDRAALDAEAVAVRHFLGL